MFRITVPATSANLGPGFDSLGMALQLYNTLEVEPSESLKIQIEGEGATSIPRNGSNLVYKSYRRTMEKLGRKPGNLFIRQHNAIPSTRGLGSSSSAVVAGILAAQAVSGQTISKEEMLLLATQIEGHPDNVAPAIYGGFVAAVGGTHDARCLSFDVPASLLPIAMIPDYELSTQKARAVLPKQVSFADAVFNVSRAAYLSAAFAKGDVDAILTVLQDRLHQPYRAALIPGFEDILDTCEVMGAPAYLSGAGPTLMALCRETDAQEFISRITPVLADWGNWRICKLPPDNLGARVETL